MLIARLALALTLTGVVWALAGPSPASVVEAPCLEEAAPPSGTRMREIGATLTGRVQLADARAECSVGADTRTAGAPPRARPGEPKILYWSSSAPRQAGKKETPEANEFGGFGALDAPDDPVEAGPCTLALRVLDTEGSPISTTLDLYRLDVPARGFYGRGDQLQQRVTLSAREGRTVVDGLPRGRYRAFLHGLAHDAEDPPAFSVRGARTHVDLVLAAKPGTHAGHLRVFDSGGREVHEGRLQRRGLCYSSDSASPPGWVQERELAAAPRGHEWLFTPPSRLGTTVGIGCHASRPRVRAMQGVGFSLGTIEDDSRASRRSRDFTFERKGLSEVDATLRGSVRRDHTLIATQVPLAWLRDMVRFPEGTKEDDRAPIEVRARSTAVRLAGRDPHEAWLDAPIEVEFKCLGFEPLEFTFTLREGPPGTRTLRPKQRAPARQGR